MNSLENKNLKSPIENRNSEASRSESEVEKKKDSKKSRHHDSSSKRSKKEKKHKKRASKSRSTSSSSSRKDSRSPSRERKYRSKRRERSRSYDHRRSRDNRRGRDDRQKQQRRRGRLTSEEKKIEEQRKMQSRLAKARALALLEEKKNNPDSTNNAPQNNFKKREDEKRYFEEQKILEEYKKRSDLFDELEEEDEPQQQETISTTKTSPKPSEEQVKEAGSVDLVKMEVTENNSLDKQEKIETPKPIELTQKAVFVEEVEEIKPEQASFMQVGNIEAEIEEGELIEKEEKAPETTFNIKVDIKPRTAKGFSVPLQTNNKTAFKSEENSKINAFKIPQIPKKTQAANEYDDPLDAYMKDIEVHATRQETFGQEKMYKMAEDQMYDDAPQPMEETFDSSKVITADEFVEELEKKKALTVRRTVRAQQKTVYGNTPAYYSNQSNGMLTKEHEQILNNFDDMMDNDDMMDEDDAMEDDEDPEEAESFHKAFLDALTNKKEDELDSKKIEERIYADDEDTFFQELKPMNEDEADDYLAKQKKLTEKKELRPVNHAEIAYDPIRKNFYIEPKEISVLSENQVNELRRKMGDIKVRGLKCPKPISNWYQCGLSERLIRVIERKAFKDPFPIQSQSIPAVMSGRDVIGIAETGSGKTLAYLLPLLRHILDQRPLREGEGPIGLIMAPTRELAMQIHKEAKIFAQAIRLRCVCVYGGAGVSGQFSDLKKGAEIVVCTPGRLIDVLTTSNGRITNLKRVSYVVLDEADRMFDMGFEPQIAKVLGNIRPDRQTVLFSATFPRSIENLAKKILQNPIEIVVGNRGQTCQNVEQLVEVREEGTKFLRLLEILGQWYEKGSILIFVDKQIEADDLFKELFKVGYQTLVLHGGQDQTDREFTIADFKAGVRNIMVATSVLARGLDIKTLVLVINFKCPNHAEDYVHRIGRTGRAGQKGTAITFVTPEEHQFAPDLIRILELSKAIVPEELRILAKSYHKKVSAGEIDYKKSSGFTHNKGFKFSEDEKSKISTMRKELSKSYGVDLFDEDESDEDIDIKGGERKEDGDKEERKEVNLLELIRDPRAKQAAMEAATSAAKDAITAGSSQEDIVRAAQEAIKVVISQYKQSVSAEKGMEEAMKIRDEWIQTENEKSGRFSTEFEINDYPAPARSKVTNRDFLSSLFEITGCNASIKGAHYDFGKRPPLGQRKQYIYIEGASKGEVANAYKEIKRMLDEASVNNIAAAAAYGGAHGKYSI